MPFPEGVFAFRFPGVQPLGLIDLFAVGRHRVTEPSYRWHGLTRGDGPLCLFQYTVAGAGLLEVNGERWKLGPGQGFLVDIPSDHEYRIDPDVGEWTIDFVLFRQENAWPLWTAARAALGPVATFPLSQGPVPALERLIRAAAEGRVQEPFEASALTYELLIALGRHAARPTPSPPAVTAALRLLDEGWNRPWKLPEVARAVGLSPAHFHRTFRLHTGVTPLEWLTRRRMEKAVELLGAPGARVEAVARQLGFADTGHFIRVFRRWTGTTPGALTSSTSVWKGSKIVLSSRENTNGAGTDSGLL